MRVSSFVEFVRDCIWIPPHPSGSWPCCLTTQFPALSHLFVRKGHETCGEREFSSICLAIVRLEVFNMSRQTTGMESTINDNSRLRGKSNMSLMRKAYQGRLYGSSATCGYSNYIGDITTKGLEHTNSWRTMHRILVERVTMQYPKAQTTWNLYKFQGILNMLLSGRYSQLFNKK
jgi:hypothetical protein